MRDKTVRTICLIMLGLAILCAVSFIFGSSLLSQDSSTEQTVGVYDIVRTPFEWLLGVGNFSTKLFRKMAHFLEYLLLGTEISLLLYITEKLNNKTAIVVLSIGLGFGIIDEVIQIFTERGPSVIDVLIDFGGFIIGTAIVFMVYMRKKSKEKNKITN